MSYEEGRTVLSSSIAVCRPYPQEDIRRWMQVVLADVRSGEQERAPQLQTGNMRQFSPSYMMGFPPKRKGPLAGLLK